ncbi:glycosyltransferase family 2 protein [Actinacidiphila yeochonensis]|uniref:glycosyltransferase family 2 protein n=1 Tax=Actinacidiphila yeochonensis TaxID=89050 RepID=UPI00055F30B5|nr:glycosyltransferase family A protein [Actinacidiphila yeochonensis]
MPVKVSVVVPVYNPGRYIEPCIASLLGQTLPAEEVELLFVDDGSTDDTPGMLDKLAAEHPQVRAVHIPNSGWPGKPRNIGVAEARGEYVHFVDQDDHLAPDALRRLYELGHGNGSDVVLGKVASNFRGVPHGVFRATRQRCTIHDAPLVDSLTPHKMFRTAFLREHGIAYPEGKRRLEDQLYMMRAYFAASCVSILGGYTCYYYNKRDDGKNAGSARIVPQGYYGNLREVLDVVVANTEPGEFRDGLLRRFYRVEMLGRLGDPAILKYPPEYLAEMVPAVRELAEAYMGDGVHDGLGALLQARSVLLRRGDAEGLVELARRTGSVKGHARLDAFRWEDGRIAVDVTARLRNEDGSPVVLVRRDGRYLLGPELTAGLEVTALPQDTARQEDAARPEAPAGEAPAGDSTTEEAPAEAPAEKAAEDAADAAPQPEAPTEDAAGDAPQPEAAAEETAEVPLGEVPVTDGLEGFKAEVSLRNRETAVEWTCPAVFEAHVEEVPGREAPDGGVPCQVVLRGTGYLDPGKVKGRGALGRGMWDVWVPVRGLGLVRKARLGADREPAVDAACLPALIGGAARPTVPYFTDPHGNLTLDVERRAKKLGGALAGHQPLRVPARDAFAVELPVVTRPDTGPSKAVLVVRGTGPDAPECQVPADLVAAGERAHLQLRRLPTAARSALGAGPVALAVLLDGEKGPELPLGPGLLDARGRLTLSEETPAVDPAAARAARARRRRVAGVRAVKLVAGPVLRRLGPVTRKRVRRWAARLAG